MPKLLRPHISDTIKCEVVTRQLIGFGEYPLPQIGGERKPEYLERLLAMLADRMECPRSELRLDHDPALQNREKVFRNGVHVGYIPDANDQAHLIYRPHGPQYAGSHLVKTLVRGDHGQLSDAALRRKEKRRLAKSDAARKTVKIKSANRWPPKGTQKIPTRPSQHKRRQA